MAFAEEEVPELSPAFEAGLDRKRASAVEIRPLRGWRRAAMLGYVVAGVGLLGWALQGVPLPTIDVSAPLGASSRSHQRPAELHAGHRRVALDPRTRPVRRSADVRAVGLQPQATAYGRGRESGTVKSPW